MREPISIILSWFAGWKQSEKALKSTRVPVKIHETNIPKATTIVPLPLHFPLMDTNNTVWWFGCDEGAHQYHSELIGWMKWVRKGGEISPQPSWNQWDEPSKSQDHCPTTIPFPIYGHKQQCLMVWMWWGSPSVSFWADWLAEIGQKRWWNFPTTAQSKSMRQTF